MDEETNKLVREFSSKFGEAELAEMLKQKLRGARKDECLTIITDDTLHQIPPEIIEGKCFVFSTGNFDSGSSEAVSSYLKERIRALAEILNSRQWSRVRLIYSGHAVLAATAKFVVYRVTHIETDDVLYFGGTGYVQVSLRMRDILSPR